MLIEQRIAMSFYNRKIVATTQSARTASTQQLPT